MGGLIHASIFLVRDYVASPRPSVIDKVLLTKGAIISHLSWVSLQLGFHVLGVWMHNDTVVAFSDPEKQILIEPVFAINLHSGSGIIALELGPGDLLAHHAFAFAIHTTVLIMVKGALDSRGSKLMPDKLHFGHSFACDGPTRGGTCDISAWDAAYLAGFWMLNTDAWVMFYFHWKNLTLFENTTFQFDESSTTLNGWFRDYLWFNSGALLNGYNALRANDLSAWSWLFLSSSLLTYVGLLASCSLFLGEFIGLSSSTSSFLCISKLQSSMISNSKTCLLQLRCSLCKLLVGLVHFAAGFIFTYPAFVLAATS
jgi:photosystem I P700 chlorophyll a apoprotein A2